VIAGERRDQPPQPPIVTLTSFLSVKTWPSLVLATTMMFCVAASRMRVVASALADSHCILLAI
jgi:hypothetical protein